MILLAAVVSFVGTNIDDLFVLMLLWSQADSRKEKISILCGRYLGMGLILAISALAAFGLRLLIAPYLGLLGVIPILLGVKEWVTYRKNSKSSDRAEGGSQPPRAGAKLLSAAVLVVSNGADNIGVYVPLFAGYGAAEMLTFVAVFVVMTAVWCLFSALLTRVWGVKERLQRYRHVLVPMVYILLGAYILAKSYLF